MIVIIVSVLTMLVTSFIALGPVDLLVVSLRIGIALSPNGRIYVSDYNNKRIQIFTNY